VQDVSIRRTTVGSSTVTVDRPRTTTLSRVDPIGDDQASEESLAAQHARTVVDVGERHGRALQGFGRRLGLTEDQAEDAAQEVLLRLFRTLRHDGPVTDPRAWVFHAMYRRAMDEHRFRTRVARIRERLAGVVGQSAADELDHAGRLSIWAAVDRLPPRQRQVLYLRYEADLAFEEVGSTMGITAGGARAIATKALDRLRALVGPEEDLR
jgi:RNA polymerase sigma factor (sigma-70 family)